MRFRTSVVNGGLFALCIIFWSAGTRAFFGSPPKRKVIHNSDNHFLWHDAVNGGDITRKQLAFRGEEAPITLSVNEWHRAERLHRRKEETVAFIARSSFAPIDRVPRMAHFVEVSKLFYRRHPKIGMGVELAI